MKRNKESKETKKNAINRVGNRVGVQISNIKFYHSFLHLLKISEFGKTFWFAFLSV